MNLLSILEGNTSLLERHERDIHRILSQFYNDHDQASNDLWPAWCYLYTRGHNPIRQETSGHRGRLTENGNIVVADTEGATQNNERYRAAEARSRDQDLSHRPRDPQTSKPQANQKEPLPLLVLDDRTLRSFQLSSQEAVLPEPSTPFGNPPREEPRQPPRCNTCAKTTKV